MRENADQTNTKYGQFLRSGILLYSVHKYDFQARYNLAALGVPRIVIEKLVLKVYALRNISEVPIQSRSTK